MHALRSMLVRFNTRLSPHLTEYLPLSHQALRKEYLFCKDLATTYDSVAMCRGIAAFLLKINVSSCVCCGFVFGELRKVSLRPLQQRY